MKTRIALLTIADIKRAVDNGHNVKCDNGAYSVIKSKGSTDYYLIKFDYSDYCIGLHGQAGTEYADQLNGRNFYYYKSMSGDSL